jgi:hypothetical protein
MDDASNAPSNLDQTGEYVLTYDEVSDEELEAAAGGYNLQLASFSIVWCCHTDLHCQSPG